MASTKLTISFDKDELVAACIKKIVEDGTLVEVVRRKDCINWERDVIFKDGFCRWKQQGDPNWFCADGERREDEALCD